METHKRDSSSELLEEIRELRNGNATLQNRLSRIESTMQSLLGQVRKLTPTAPPETVYENIDQFITEQIQHNLEEQEAHEGETPGESSSEVPEEVNWEFFVAQKGGFDEMLYMTVQDFLGIHEKNSDRLVKFLIQKHAKEVEESFQHLRTEYENLEGSQLQSHFTKLWELHHKLLEKKIIRTWKEEIFLEAFNRFIRLLQQ